LLADWLVGDPLTQAQAEWTQEPIERVLRRIVPRADGRKTIGGAMSIEAANSFTPIARMILPSATWLDTPSSMAASRNLLANVLLRRPLASPPFQSLLRLATIRPLHPVRRDFMHRSLQD